MCFPLVLPLGHNVNFARDDPGKKNDNISHDSKCLKQDTFTFKLQRPLTAVGIMTLLHWESKRRRQRDVVREAQSQQ